MNAQKSTKLRRPAVRVAGRRNTLAEKIPYYVGFNSSVVSPSDASKRHKEILREVIRKNAYE